MNPTRPDDTLTPSQFVYLHRNKLRDLYVKRIGHAAPVLKTSMIMAYTQALDDVTNLLSNKDNEMKQKRIEDDNAKLK